MIESVLEATFVSNLVDKVITALVAFALVRALPLRTVARFPRSENVVSRA